jgi:multiple sugar transport system substrate-binding protein
MFHPSPRIPRTRLVTALALVFATLLPATGAGPIHAASAPIQITVGGCWADPIQGGAFIRIAEGFNKVQSAIHVKAIRGVNQTRVLAGVSAGNPIDVYYDCTTSDLPQWAASGYALNLDPYIKQEHFNLKSVIPSALAFSTYNGSTYSLPLLEDTFMLIYNKKMFADAGITSPPTTIEQMTADAKKLTKKDANGHLTQLGWAPTLYGGDYIGTWLSVYQTMFGGKLVDSSGKKITANCPECVAALQWETDFIKWVGPTEMDRFTSDANSKEYSAANLVFNNKLAMVINGEYWTGMIKAYAAKGFQWGNAPLPYPAKRPDLAGTGVAGGNPGTLMKGSKHPLEAFKFMEYMESVGPTVDFANAIHNVPQLFAALKSPKLDPEPHYRAFVKYAQGPKVTAFPVIPVSADFADALGRYEALVVHGKMSAQDGLNKVTTDTQQKLDAQQAGL